MGFDIYGLKPENPGNIIKPEHFDWADDTVTKETKDEYYKAINEYEENVICSYFRNNVWWWRALWKFVSGACDDFLNDKDLDGGCENGGHVIGKTKAKRIAARIRKLDKMGVIDAYEEEVTGIVKSANENNKKVRAEMDAITKACQKEHGSHMVPANYPEPYKSQWNKAYAKEDWAGHYPFSADNVRHFAQFCDSSGGFEIC